MRVSRDTSERIRVLFAFLLEIYKVATGTLLSVFVAHNCPDSADECTVAESFHPANPLAFGTLVLNGTTLFFVCTLYVVELGRENFMIYAFDINPDFPDTYLDDGAPWFPAAALLEPKVRRAAAVAAVLALGTSSCPPFSSSATSAAAPRPRPAPPSRSSFMKLYGSSRSQARQPGAARAVGLEKITNVMDADYR